ncbi:YIP1 family protein [Halorarum halophilum]|uniref:YIP1 family protein n=1 Tax=Halorarum halophilum TaxID=2743090 RepID=A0A7D5GAL8_9EURY|nr:Yip1 family protein [Halobaculum halophilum]QLG26565.1 YIP1 family protein [Halobaculum halophilum]
MPSTPLFDPRAFFTERNPSLRGAAAILYFAGIAPVSTGAIATGGFGPADVTGWLLLLAVLVGAAGGAVVIWTVYAVGIYLATAVAGGTGSFTRTAANVGWSLLPLLLGNVVTSLARWGVYLSGRLSGEGSVRFPSWLDGLSLVVAVGCYLWIGYLLVYAIEDARDVSVQHATVIAAIVALVSVLVSVGISL